MNDFKWVNIGEQINRDLTNKDKRAIFGDFASGRVEKVYPVEFVKTDPDGSFRPATEAELEKMRLFTAAKLGSGCPVTGPDDPSLLTGAKPC
jgi:hypothetical protein